MMWITKKLRAEWKQYGIDIWYGDNHPILKSFSFLWYWSWISKPQAWLACRTNKAVKGQDSCYSFQIHLFCFCFIYTDWSYWRFKHGTT